MTFSAWTFGAPVTDPGGNVARSSAPSPTPSRSSRLDARDEVPQPRVRLDVRRRRRVGRVPYARDAPEVVAHEVDDHHVLGRVLGRGGERVAGAAAAARDRRRRAARCP